MADEHPITAGIYTSAALAMQAAELAARAAENAFNWQQDLLYPAIVMAANWWFEEQRNDDRDDLFATMRSLSQTALDDYVTCIDTTMAKWEAKAPQTPDAAEYIPVNCCTIYAQTIACNLGLMSQADNLIASITEFHTLQALQRAMFIDGKWQEKNDLIICQIHGLLEGRLPISDHMENFTDSCERAAMVGGLGGSQQSRRQDLGISELRARREGFENEITLRQSYARDIAPLERMGDIRSMLKDPKLAVELAQLQAVLKQNSDQNKFNLAAIIDPTIADRMAAELTKCTAVLQGGLNKALLQNMSLPNFQQYAQPLINGIAKGVSGAFGESISNQIAPRQVQIEQRRSPNTSYTPQYSFHTGFFVTLNSRFLTTRNFTK